MRIAALDLGSNSFQLLVASVRDDGLLRRRAQLRDTVRLGARSLPSGELPDAALRRAVRAVVGLRAAADDYGARPLLAVATSAVREAPNRAALVLAARKEAGVDVRVIDGAEEARLAFLGSVASIGSTARGRRVLVIDVGGGSTELAVGEVGGTCDFVESLRLGSLTVDPGHQRRWRRRQRREARERCREALAGAIARAKRQRVDLVALSCGTARALARLAGCPYLGPQHDRAIDLDDVADLGRRLSKLSLEERRLVPGLPERRAETIVGGAMILRIALELAGFDRAIVTEGGLREGVIIDHLRADETRAKSSFRLAAA